MASITTATTIVAASPPTENLNPFFLKTSQLSIPRCRKRHLVHKISCKMAKNNDQNSRTTHNESVPYKLDRRNMLIGLGGLCGAAATALGGAPSTSAAPITTPAPADCGPATLPETAQGDRNCCPPETTTVLDFTPPPSNTSLRVRPSAHMLDDAYLEKYTTAMSLMRALPDSDPRSFSQQAKVHCAYCSAGYHQEGFPTKVLQVHGSWLFLPFHRYYLYFYERILGSLINDPTFAIPFWNWDHPDGMRMPTIYTTDQNSPLYDPLRDAAHQPPTVIDLNFDGVDETGVSDDQFISNNLAVMYRQMVTNARTPTLFLGQPYRAGDSSTRGAGSLENVPHGPVHVWTGDRSQPNLENMGNFYSAARDPIFFAHHANVDRMWSIWKTLGTNRDTDFTDTDWLDASFVFFDENARAVRVRVRDCLDNTALGYTYQNVELPWLNTTPQTSSMVSSRVSSRAKTLQTLSSSSDSENDDNPNTTLFPVTLETMIKTTLKRPKPSRTQQEKASEEEVLVIQLDLLHDKYVKFDVYVNDEDDEIPSKEMQMKTEYAGSFVNVPHKPDEGGEMKMSTSLRVGLTQLIEVLGADDDESVVVSLVPKCGNEDVVINSVSIELVSVD